MARMLVGLFLLFILLSAGCRDTAESGTSSNQSKSAGGAAKTIEFNGVEWSYVGPTKNTGDVLRPSMSAFEYRTEKANVQLLELKENPQAVIKEGVFSRMLRVQIEHNGRWVTHGKTAEWLLDGGRSEATYVNGELHGLQRDWYPNGQLRFEREWQNNKMNGRDRGWYKSGKPKYDVINVDNKEVTGKSWSETGEKL